MLRQTPQTSLNFRSVAEVFTYADAHSVTFKNATQQTVLSKYQTLAAQLSKWNLKGTIDFSGTDNTKLQSSFFAGADFWRYPRQFQAHHSGTTVCERISNIATI